MVGGVTSSGLCNSSNSRKNKQAAAGMAAEQGEREGVSECVQNP